ncbi:hypothetical protein m02_10320 [Bartonella bovis m02]|uniref:Right handed beta helix domain-containing protein n=2 Tax=Bartonella bovis TaxID=155194 RepID=N6VDR8_9HYPH|nr:hypothetical protein m02_10320 [Bartonella bovis m02]
MGSMEKLMMMRDVTFENVSEGINIKGGMEGVMVMGMGTGLEKTTMTVNGKDDGVVGIKVEDTEKINATVMGLNIVGDRSGGKGVEFIGKGGKGTLMLNMVEISGFATGVSASGKGMVNIMGESAITFTSGTGLEVKDTANATMMGGTIKGTDGKGYGVKMMGEGTVKMSNVGISEVKMGVEVKSGQLEMNMVGISNVEKGVSVSKGTVEMMGTTIMVKSGDSGNSGSGYGVGVGVSGNGTVKMMGTTIMVTSGGTGKGTGVYVGGGGKVEMTSVDVSGFEKGVSVGGGTVTMDKVGISGVKMGVEVKSGTVMMKGGWIKGMGTGYGVIMEGGTVTMMDKVWISQVEKGVYAKSGTLKMMGGSAITFAGGTGSYGVKVGGTATAHLTDVKIRGRVDRGRGWLWGVGR